MFFHGLPKQSAHYKKTDHRAKASNSEDKRQLAKDSIEIRELKIKVSQLENRLEACRGALDGANTIIRSAMAYARENHPELQDLDDWELMNVFREYAP